MKPQGIGDKVADAHLRHAVHVSRFVRGQMTKAQATTEKASLALRGAIMTELLNIRRRGPAASPTERAVFRALQDRIDNICQVLAGRLLGDLMPVLRDFAKTEAEWNHAAVKQAGADAHALDLRKLGDIAAEQMIGRTMAEWCQSIGDGLGRRIKTELGIGLNNGETDTTISARLTKGYEDANRATTAVTATAFRHVQAQVLQRFAELNS